MNGDAATLLVNLCVCGPMIYLGLWVMIGPSKMVSILNHLEGELRSFRDNFESPHWRDALHEAGSVPDSPASHSLIRLFGLALVIAGLVRLAGMAG